MARQDQTLRFGLEVDGQKGLADIATGLQAIVAAGGEAAPAAQKLLDVITELSTTANAATGLIAQKTAAVELGDAFAAARLKVEQLEAQFDAAEAPTAKLSASLARARQSAADLGAQFNAQQAAIARTELSLEAAGVDLNNLDAEQRRLAASLTLSATEAKAFSASMAESAAANQAEALSLSEITERSALLRASFEQLKVLLTTFAGFFALEKAKEEIGDLLATGDKFKKFGTDFANAFGSVDAGGEALDRVKTIAEAVPLSLDQVAAAALQAKKEGLDPFDGSLQALIDTTVKFGGGSDQLNQLILTLGKSANQGGLNLRTLTTLEQQGIPAAKLLGDEIGKTAAQVTELAKQGKLGSDSVSALISALGKANTGAVASQMQLLGTQVTKAKDNFEEFLNLIANSGAYDFVRDELQKLNQEFKVALEDGSLEESARNISNSLISLGTALIDVTKFAIDNAGAIKTVVEGYALFKGAMLGLDLLGAAEKMLGLATATKAVGDAAEIAAAEGGGFGKLKTAINNIPKNVQIAVAAAGVAEVLLQLSEILDTSIAIAKLDFDQLGVQKQDAALKDQLLQKAKAIADQTRDAAKTQIADATDLAAKNKDQSAAYIKSLQDAIRYFTALSVQDKAIGDAPGATAASAKAKQYAAALKDAVDHQKELTTALAGAAGAAADVSARFFDVNLHALAAASAVKGIFDNVDVKTPKGLGEVLSIIDSVKDKSKDARAAIQDELIGALEKLNDADLTAFQANVTKRLAEAKGNADDLRIALGAALQAELERLGLSAEQAGIKFSAAGTKIISTFGDIASNAQASGQQIQLAFAQALTKVTTTGEVEALQQQLQKAFDAGRISAGQFQVASEAAGRKLADITIAAATASQNLDGMGTAGQTAAQRIAGSLQDARDKLVVQANQIATAITAALQARDNADALKAQLHGVETELQGVNDQINQVAPNLELAGVAGSIALAKLAGQSRDTADALALANAQQTKGISDVDKALQGSGRSAADLSKEIADIGTGGFPTLSQELADTRAGFLGVSQAAAELFDKFLSPDAPLFDAIGTGFDALAERMATAATRTKQVIADQETDLQNELNIINQIGSDGSHNLDQFGDSADVVAVKLDKFAKAIAAGNVDAGVLGQESLQPLQQALETARDRVQALADATKAAKEQFDSLAQSTQDALDQATGNESALEDRRHQQQLDDLQSAAKAANELNSDQYNQAVAAENALHALKMKNIADEQAAAKKNNSNPPPDDTSPTPTSSPTKPTGGSGGAAASIGAAITINVQGSVIGADPSTLAEELARIIKPQLDAIAKRSQ